MPTPIDTSATPRRRRSAAPAGLSRSTRGIWLTIVSLGAVDALWVMAAGRSIAWPGLIYLGLALGILEAIAVVYHRTGRSAPLARAAQAAAQLIAFASAEGVYMYLVTSTNAPATDALLARADHAIGFDWVVWSTLVQAHGPLSEFLKVAYDSMIPQTVICALYLALRGSSDEFIWTIVIASIISISVSGLVPAIGNLPDAPHVSHFLALRSGAMRQIDLRGMQGLVAFPSFHAAAAILLVSAVRREPGLLAASAVLNAAMFLSTIPVGGHYLVDVLAGAIVAGVAIAAARWIASALDTESRDPAARDPARLAITVGSSASPTP